MKKSSFITGLRKLQRKGWSTKRAYATMKNYSKAVSRSSAKKTSAKQPRGVVKMSERQRARSTHEAKKRSFRGSRRMYKSKAGRLYKTRGLAKAADHRAEFRRLSYSSEGKKARAQRRANYLRTKYNKSK